MTEHLDPAFAEWLVAVADPDLAHGNPSTEERVSWMSAGTVRWCRQLYDAEGPVAIDSAKARLHQHRVATAQHALPLIERDVFATTPYRPRLSCDAHTTNTTELRVNIEGS